jgi:mannose-6-phosphate isomerase-like protein (cupin superfamily)
VLEILMPPDDMPPLHVHRREDEVFQILEGEIEFHLAGQPPARALPGTCVCAPRGVPHTYRVVSDVPARTLVTVVPAGFDRFVRDAGEPARGAVLPPQDAEPDMARLMRAADDAGIEILGPPGMLPQG